MRAWVVRVGAHGEREKVALDEGFAIAGWPDLGDIDHCTDLTGLRVEVSDTYPAENERVISNWTGQLWRFKEEMAEGDYVVLPLKSTHSLALGRIAGPYEYHAEAADGFRHRRSVSWDRKDLPRKDVKGDLGNSLGSLLTVFELTRHHAAARIEQLARTGVDPGYEDESTSTATSLPKLAEEVSHSSPDDPVTMTIRSLLDIWGASRRTASSVDEIRHGLAEQGLSTTPPFTDGAIDSIITVIAIGPGPDAPGRRLPDRSRTEAIEDVDSADEPLTLRISNMPSANLASRDARLVTVHLNDPLERAATLMTARNFSQLPVVGTESGNPSAISWRSIGQARLSMSNPMLRDALDENIRIVQLHDPLLGWVDAIYRDGYVLVTESIGTLTGIVTAADLTERFHQEQRPYVLLEEMERRLRRSLVRAGFTSSQLHQYARGVKPENLASKKEQLSVEKLTIKEYCTLLADFEAWKILMWQVDQKTLLEYLEKVRDIRNSLMHFRDGLDPVGPEQLDIIGGAVSIIKAADPRP